MDSTLVQEDFRPGVNKMDADIGGMKRKRSDTPPTHKDVDEAPPTKKCPEEEAFALADCEYPTTGILDMCDEVLTAIFRHVDSFTLLSLMNSNQRFKRLLCDRYFWIHIDLSQKPLPLGILEDVLEWSSVKTEYIKFHGPTPDELGDGEIKQFCTIMANSFSTRCTQLRELELQHVVIDFSFLNILNFPKTLKRLMIKNCCVRERKIHSIFYGIETHLVKLEELGFEYCDWFEPYFIMGISKVPTLRWLSLKGCRQLAEFVPYGSMATRFGFKKLEYLDLRFTPLTDSDLQCFNVVHTLKEILLDCPDNMRRGSAASRAEAASRRRIRSEAVPGLSISTEAEEAAPNPNMPSTSRGCGSCGVSVDVAGPSVELAPLQVARVAQSGSVLAIVLEGAPHMGGGGGGAAPNAPQNGVANANLMADQAEAPPAPQPNEPPAADAPPPEAAAVLEAAPAVEPAPPIAAPVAAGRNEPAAAGVPAADEQPSPSRAGYRGMPYPLVISLAAMQRGEMPNAAAGGAPRPANGADDVSAAVAAYRGVVGAARAVAERLQNEERQVEQPAQPPAMGEVICLDINNPRRPIFIQGVQRGLRVQPGGSSSNNSGNNNNPNNANNANQPEAAAAAAGAANENANQNNANNNNNQNNANNVNGNAHHAHMHNLDRVVRHPMFWDLIDPLARQAGGLGVLGNNGAGAGAPQPGGPGAAPGAGNPLLQLCRNMRFGGDAGGRSRYAFFRTAHPISDRGICCFGRPRNPVEQGIIWIRVGNRPANTNFIRISVRNYIQVTDISLRHLAVCAPYLRFLDVSGTGVTRDGIEKFKRQNITCHIVAEHLRYDDGYDSRSGDSDGSSTSSDSSEDAAPAVAAAEGGEQEMREGVRRQQDRAERRNQDYDEQRNQEARGNGEGNGEGNGDGAEEGEEQRAN